MTVTDFGRELTIDFVLVLDALAKLEFSYPYEFVMEIKAAAFYLKSNENCSIVNILRFAQISAHRDTKTHKKDKNCQNYQIYH